MGEFSCNCGCDTHLKPEIKDNIIKFAPQLQMIRDHFGVSVHINSAVRCPDHNKRVKGGKNSQHLLGRAFDIRVEGVSPDDVARWIDEQMFHGNMLMGGLGRYNTFTHVDFRGTPARWDYRT